MKPFAKVLPIAAAGALSLVALPSTAASASSDPAGTPARAQGVATLRANHTVYGSPGGRREGSVSKKRPITSEQTSLPVLRTASHGGAMWLLVRLPGRPNSHTGWISAAHTTEWEDSWHIDVSTGQRRAYIYNHGQLVRDWLVAVGTPSAPTPHGQFFVEENVDERNQHPCFPGEPYALATSARSKTFTEFDGGPGQVALHGMGCGLYAKPGTAASHGCVRFLNHDITWLAARIDPGTPITVTG